MSKIDKVSQLFQQRFGRVPRIFSAPGRVNLIGEHTDYNDGLVLPMALDRRTYVAAAPRADKRIQVYASDLDRLVTFDLAPDLKPLAATDDDSWSNYARGVVACLERDWYSLGGADLVIASEVPLGAGLSSSAAFEAAVAYALLLLNDQSGNMLDLALTLQKAEHEYAGTQCGIMDQYIVCNGRAGHALLIDCRTLGSELVPINLSDARVVVCNTMVKHALATSEYNTRRAECNEGVRRLAQHFPGLHSLRDVQLEEFDQVAATLPDVIRRRCNHVITENARVALAIDALKQNDLKLFGQLMYASHESLRHDYEVSCAELDLLVEIAASCAGVYGARMTGGGFGGCTVNLVATSAVPQFLSTVQAEYHRRTGITPDCYVCAAADGVREES